MYNWSRENSAINANSKGYYSVRYGVLAVGDSKGSKDATMIVSGKTCQIRRVVSLFPSGNEQLEQLDSKMRTQRRPLVDPSRADVNIIDSSNKI